MLDRWLTISMDLRKEACVSPISYPSLRFRQGKRIWHGPAQAFNCEIEKLDNRGEYMHMSREQRKGPSSVDQVHWVVVSDSVSSWTKGNSRVSQGSVLGPLLFNVTINDKGEGTCSNISIFDTKLSWGIGVAQDTQELQEDLDRIGGWAVMWIMRFNKNKC